VKCAETELEGDGKEQKAEERGIGRPEEGKKQK
jgi:hypothetical protein